MIRAKFKVDKVTEVENGSQIALHAVTTGSPENESFYSLTPGGSIQLSIVSPDTAANFEVGKEYYVDFTLAPEEVKVEDAPVEEAASEDEEVEGEVA